MGILTHQASTVLIRMCCPRPCDPRAAGSFAFRSLSDQWKQRLGGDPHLIVVEFFREKARSVILYELQLFGRNIDGVALHHVGVFGGWRAVDRSDELVGH